jgi:hypothetical protein
LRGCAGRSQKNKARYANGVDETAHSSSTPWRPVCCEFAPILGGLAAPIKSWDVARAGF